MRALSFLKLPGVAGVVALAAMTALSSPHTAMAKGKTFAQAVSAVENLDQNGDGKVGPDEWQKSPEIFKKIDKDKDGFLSPQDFAKHWGVPVDDAAPRQPEPAASTAEIPLIDAHSQVDCNVTEDTVLRQITNLNISRVLISIRGCQGWNTDDLEGRSLKWSKANPDKISALLSTKVDGWSFNALDSARIDSFLLRARRNGFVGMGEILVQHAAHDHARLSYPELSLRLNDPRIEAATKLGASKGWPVILHIELNDNEEQSAQTVDDLKALLNRYPDTAFLLIHMGQATPDEARTLLENHKNIHFLTTTADDFAAHVTAQAKKKGKVAQTGWINLFQGNCPLTECPSAWNPDWKALISEFPDRFVLAFENVFPPHWEKPYEIKVGIWRRALKMLPDEVAHALAHRNAERLWKLPPAR